MEDKVLFTPEEVAEMLKLSKYTVYEMIKRGEIKALKIGRGIRISQDHISEYFEMSSNTKNLFTSEVLLNGSLGFVDLSGVRIFVPSSVKGRARIYISPETIVIAMDEVKSSARNNLKCLISEISVEKDRTMLTLEVIGSNPPLYFDAKITNASLKDLGLKKGQTVFALFKTMSVKVMML
ncbi:MAG: helix-turn-helix domain-containing protein [Clostridiaceae bacterium]